MEHFIRLVSVVPHGVMVGAGCIEAIYANLLGEFGMKFYSHIQINQIGCDLEEFVLKDANMIHINIRFPAPEDFETIGHHRRNMIRLELAHLALLRVAAFDLKFDIDKLNLIKQKIVDNKFVFEFIHKSFKNKARGIACDIIVRVEGEWFDIYVSILSEGKEKCRLFVYKSLPVPFILYEFFSKAKWQADTLIVSGRTKDLVFHVHHLECKVTCVNLTAYKNPPSYISYCYDSTREERELAYLDYLHALPPATAAILRDSFSGAN